MIIPIEINGVKVTQIGIQAFAGYSIKNIILPTTITKINDSAFISNNTLQSFIMPDSVTEIGSGVFQSNNNLRNIVLSKNVKSIPVATLMHCNFETLVIPEGVERIESSAINDNNYLKNLSLPSTLKTLDNDSIILTSLESLTIPENVILNERAITSNQLLKKVVIKSKVTPIFNASTLLGANNNLEELTFHNGLEQLTIGYSPSLKTLTLPKSLISLSLDKISKPLTINFEGTEVEWQTIRKIETSYDYSQLTINYNYKIS